MVDTNRMYRKLLEQVAKDIGREFDYLDLLHGFRQLPTGRDKRKRQRIPEANAVKALVKGAGWARPVGMRIDRTNSTERTMYVYDPNYGEQRRNARVNA
jgi:hypothetical protein